MKQLAARWSAWWAAQAKRQQWMVLGALLVAGLGLTDTLVLVPAEKDHKQLRALSAKLNDQARQRQAQAAAQAAEQQALHAEEAALRQRLAAADAAIAQARASLAGPEVLRQRIRDLAQDGTVRLVSLTTQPAEPVLTGARSNAAAAPAGAAAAPPANAGPAPTIYRMPVTATVEGPYAALRDHLAALERSDQGLHWQSLALDNAHWPQVRMELKLMLLSDRAQWRGP